MWVIRKTANLKLKLKLDLLKNMFFLEEGLELDTSGDKGQGDKLPARDFPFATTHHQIYNRVFSEICSHIYRIGFLQTVAMSPGSFDTLWTGIKLAPPRYWQEGCMGLEGEQVVSQGLSPLPAAPRLPSSVLLLHTSSSPQTNYCKLSIEEQGADTSQSPGSY